MDDSTEKFIPLRIPTKIPLLNRPMPSIDVSEFSEPDQDMYDIAGPFLDAIMNQNLIAAEEITMRDPDMGLSFEDKCRKYLGLDDMEIKRITDLITKDLEEDNNV